MLAPRLAIAGHYQRTRDGRTLVWNDNPGRGEAAAWSGKRDSEGYATGEGKLTWYAALNKTQETGTYIAAARKYEITGEYVGTMERGRLLQEGNVAAKNASTPPPKSVLAKGGQEKAIAKPASTVAEIQSSPPAAKVTPPEKDVGATRDIPAEGPSPTPAKAKEPSGLDTLARPPSSLRLKDESSPTPSPSEN